MDTLCCRKSVSEVSHLTTNEMVTLENPIFTDNPVDISGAEPTDGKHHYRILV
jgi:hypothetical protein